MEDKSELARLSLDPSVFERFQSPAQRAERSKKGTSELLRGLRDEIYSKLEHPSQNLTIELQTRPILMKGTSAARSARVAIGVPEEYYKELTLTFTGIPLGESMGQPSDTWRLKLEGLAGLSVEKLARRSAYAEPEYVRVNPDGRAWEELYKTLSFITGEIKRQRIMSTETQTEKDLKEIADGLKTFAAQPDLVPLESIPKTFRKYILGTYRKYYPEPEKSTFTCAWGYIAGTGDLFRQLPFANMRTSREMEEAADNPDFPGINGVRINTTDIAYGLAVVKDEQGVPKVALLVGLRGILNPDEGWPDFLQYTKPTILSRIHLGEGIVTGLADDLRGTFLGDSQIGITDHVRRTANWIKAIAEDPKRPNRDLVYPGTKWDYTVEGEGDLTVKLTPEGRERLRQEAKSLREEFR